MGSAARAPLLVGDVDRPGDARGRAGDQLPRAGSGTLPA